MMLTESKLLPTEDIYNFVKDYYEGLDREEIIKILDWHWVYGTLDAVYKDGKIVAAVRWNVSRDGKIFDVLDLIITKDEQGIRIIKHFIARNWGRFPSVRYIRFQRGQKYPFRDERMYKITRVLGLREGI